MAVVVFGLLVLYAFNTPCRKKTNDCICYGLAICGG
jgi:hypothetical protein